ncbi:hypothetical protein ACWCYL_13060 [Streptomyces sp. 900105755]
MRATKHAAPQPWHGRGLVTNIPLALLFTAVQPDVAQATCVQFARQ